MIPKDRFLLFLFPCRNPIPKFPISTPSHSYLAGECLLSTAPPSITHTVIWVISPFKAVILKPEAL